MKLLILVLSLISVQILQAKETPVQLRLFLGPTYVNPKNTNDELSLNGLKKFDMISQIGFEITYPLQDRLNVGGRYTKFSADVTEDPDNSLTDYNAKIEQDALLLIARYSLYKSEHFRFDLYAGAGGAGTKLDIKSAAQNGSYEHKATNSWFGTPYGAAGLSGAIGDKNIFLVVEAGYQMNKVDQYETSGTVTGNIKETDLSGSYFTIGLMLDGIPGSVN